MGKGHERSASGTVSEDVRTVDFAHDGPIRSRPQTLNVTGAGGNRRWPGALRVACGCGVLCTDYDV